MVDPSPEGAVSRFVSACFGIFLAALALWAAVEILRSILIWLVAAAAVALIALATAWLWRSRRSPW